MRLHAFALCAVVLGCLVACDAPTRPSEPSTTTPATVQGNPLAEYEQARALRECYTDLSDSASVEYCTHGDTTWIAIGWRQYYHDLHPDFPHNGGGVEYTIIGTDTLDTRTW